MNKYASRELVEWVEELTFPSLSQVAFGIVPSSLEKRIMKGLRLFFSNRSDDEYNRI